MRDLLTLQSVEDMSAEWQGQPASPLLRFELYCSLSEELALVSVSFVLCSSFSEESLPRGVLCLVNATNLCLHFRPSWSESCCCKFLLLCFVQFSNVHQVAGSQEASFLHIFICVQ
jgi:hypothetical protein